MAEFIDDNLDTKFSAAADFLPSLVSTLKNDQLLKFYAFFKQATTGKCNTPSPYWYSFQNKQKWDAWNSLGEMSKEEAKRNYVALLDEVSPDWEYECREKKKASWVSVSTMLSEDSEIEENEKDIFDWVRDGDIEKVNTLIDVKKIDDLDENGMNLLHWAADRGLTEMVACLLELGSDINSRDSEGQTALHYAACCGHLETARLLLSKGARTDVVCEEGFTPLDLTSDQMKEMFISIIQKD